MSRYTKTDREEATERLRALLKPGDTVTGIVRTVARSGMSRTIDFYAGSELGQYLTGYMAKALDLGRTPDGAVRVHGCGMDMIFATVYDLSRTLFQDGYALKNRSL
jgi:hypothetical protein